MSGWDGNGNWVRYYSWTNDAANSINITASRVDTEDNGFATALGNCLTRDGQGKPTQALTWFYGLTLPTITTTGNGTIGGNLGVTGNLNVTGTFAASGPYTGGASGAIAATTLSASSTVSGTGFTSLFASPPPIGSTAPNTGKFTQAFTAPNAVTFSATAMTLDCSQSNVFTTTFTANVTVAPTISNPADGQTINWFITQDGTGTRTMTWPSSFKWPGGSAIALSTGINAVDLLVATYRASTGFWYCSLSKAFA